MLILFLRQADRPFTSFSTLIVLEVLLAAGISLTYAPWMAAYTEMIEAKNPALVGTGLALWGWILRLVVGLSFIFLPLVINAVNPVVDNLVYAQTSPTGSAPFNVQAFQVHHPKSVAFAEANASWLQVLSEPKNAPVVAAANADASAANLAALQQAVGPAVFAKVIANVNQLKTLVVPYQSQLTYLADHQGSLTTLVNGVNRSPEAVAAVVLGLRRRHGPLHPDHLAQPGPLEPEQGPGGRDRAQPGGRARTARAGGRRHLTGGVPGSPG